MFTFGSLYSRFDSNAGVAGRDIWWSHRVSSIGDKSCRLLIVPLFRGSSRFESLILSHHSRFNVTCECHQENIDDEDVW